MMETDYTVAVWLDKSANVQPSPHRIGSTEVVSARQRYPFRGWASDPLLEL